MGEGVGLFSTGKWNEKQLDKQEFKKVNVAGMTKEKLLKGTVVEYSFREVRARQPKFREV